MRNFLRIIVGVKYHKQDLLKKNKQFVIVSNHNSHLDTMALLSALSSTQLVKTHPVAAGDYFGQSPVRAFFTRYFVNAILIPRTVKKGEQNPIRVMSEILKKGHSLILFPEGSRGEPEKMQEFKKGIGLLMKMNPQVHYIPVFMKGMGKVLPRGERLLVPFDAYVCFGEPILCRSTDVEAIVCEIEKSIMDLAEITTIKPEK
ncbi:MAG: 1-acyl-sn-glycerol-3-phosphate acyltransferase [Bacteroidetes bacterium]|nr:1-acyl-sn-glycerol-3-phosphate acyltransferase [Bacteroidota bacterium]